MIDFNTKDDNMLAIKNATKFTNFVTKNEYRIYGLAFENGEHWPIQFSAQECYLNSEQEKVLTNFLTTNGIDAALEDVKTSDKKVYIGLRRDLRDDIELCAVLIRTFVHYLEGSLEIPPDAKMANLPKFKMLGSKS